MLSAIAQNPGRSTAEQSPARVARRAVSDVIRAVERVRTDGDVSPKQVHALRRACRTSGVVLDILSGCVDSVASARLQKHFRKIRRRAGAIRDLDVHAELAKEFLADSPLAEDLVEEIDNARPKVESRLLELLDAVTPARLRRLRAKLDRAEPRDSEEARRRIARRAERWIDRANAVLARPLPGDPQLHELRIDLKRLRIALRTLRALGARATKRKEAIFADTARHLGRFHDLATLRERLDAHEGSQAVGLGRLLARIRSEEADSIVRARDSLRKLRSA